MQRHTRTAWLAGTIACLTMLAACSKDSTSTSDSPSAAAQTSPSAADTAANSAAANSAATSSAPSSAAGPTDASSADSSPATPAASSSSSTAAPAGPATTINYMDFSASGGHEKDLASIATAFEKANPGITVKIENVAYADYFTKLQTAVAGGSPADAFELDYQNFVSYQNSGALAELTGVDGAAYRKSLFDAFAVDGKQYGLPESFSDVVLFYNKTLFQKAGVALPTASWTWADEKAAAQKLTDKANKVWGDYQPISYNEFYKALAQSGGQFFNAGKTAATFDSPQGIAAANWLIGKSGTVMPTAADGSGTPDFDVNLFKSGKLAMWHTGIWEFSAMDKVPFDWDVVVEPGNTTKASAMFANTAVVSAQSKNQAAAQKWVQFLTSSDAAISTRLSTSWELPPTSDDAKLSSYLKAGKPANRQAVFDALDKTILAPVITSQQEMQDTIDNALTGAAAGRTPIDKALADAQSKVTGLLGQ